MSTPDYKFQAAEAALQTITTAETISPNQLIGFGAGSTIAHLITLIANVQNLVTTLTVTSSSFKTTQLLQAKCFQVKHPTSLESLDLYFDGCDQFDPSGSALKSGGGIHSTEKILAAMAKEFILIGDAEKFLPQLDARVPLVLEILPAALASVQQLLIRKYPDATFQLRMSTQKDGALISDNGNYLADLHFVSLPTLEELNAVKMIPGIVDHSLFYRMAHKAIIAGPDGTRIFNLG